MVKRPSPKPVRPPPPAANRYVCVHGHFYQPPRENPWLETVEVQDSAAPWHDWNERITAECYAPNGASRITNQQNEIVRIVNNYSRMSFNFGPTLLKWLADKAPRTYRMILDADKASAQRYSGHGSAIAQVYNHIIMPLASRRDALTQIRWGIADFEHRFGRRPEGMWLAETAVSHSVLDMMAAEGIKFTILAPHQCARVRKIAVDAVPSTDNGQRATDNWAETTNGNATVDPTHPYLIQLDEGRSIAVFFYDGPPSRAIAFEGLLNSGEGFGARLLNGFRPASSEAPDAAQLSHVATDGESYGHHHKYGEMALSYAMHWIEDNGHARLTNYGEFLANFPPQWEAEVVEDTSWSCVHGVERWRSDCGCNGGKPGWNQQWRAPLREALDYLRDATAPLAEQLAHGLLTDLWVARDAYIELVLDRSPSNKDRFFMRHGTHVLNAAERVRALELLELERHTQLMYTSCGWFFDEVSGIETIQIIAYAGRVLQLAAKLFGAPGAALEARFLEILANAQSNLPENGDAADLYRRYVTATRIDLDQVGAHYAISSIFRSYPDDVELFCFDVHREANESLTSGRGKVALGRRPSSAPASPRRRRNSATPSFTSATRTSPPLSATTASPAPTSSPHTKSSPGKSAPPSAMPTCRKSSASSTASSALSPTRSPRSSPTSSTASCAPSSTAPSPRWKSRCARSTRTMPRCCAFSPSPAWPRRPPSRWPPTSPPIPACAAPSRRRTSTPAKSRPSSSAPPPTRSPSIPPCSASPLASA